jgi:alpha-D-ribose 1-methylphosphonate 5-triphosphate synthase subunit PhnL
MNYLATFFGGFTAGAVLTGIFHHRAVKEILSLRAFLRAELQKLEAKL